MLRMELRRACDHEAAIDMTSAPIFVALSNLWTRFPRPNRRLVKVIGQLALLATTFGLLIGLALWMLSIPRNGTPPIWAGLLIGVTLGWLLGQLTCWWQTGSRPYVSASGRILKGLKLCHQAATNFLNVSLLSRLRDHLGAPTFPSCTPEAQYGTRCKSLPPEPTANRSASKSVPLFGIGRTSGTRHQSQSRS